MATPLTLDVDQQYELLPRLWRYEFVIPSVAASSTSARFSVSTRANEGRIVYVRLAYDNAEEITFHVYTVDGAVRESINEILRVEEIVRCLTLPLPEKGIPYTNADGEKCDTELYFDVDNVGTGPTGDITVELLTTHEGIS